MLEAAALAEVVDEAASGCARLLLEPERVVVVGAEHRQPIGVGAAGVVHRDGGGAALGDVDEVDVGTDLGV